LTDVPRTVRARLSLSTLAVIVGLTAGACSEARAPARSEATQAPGPGYFAMKPAPGDGASANESIPGEPQAEPATFHSLGVRWPIRGDANLNASIAVQYIKRGESEWRNALPLFRIDPESISDENQVAGGWLFAGSIVDLLPGTEYAVALTLKDPDGGDVQRVLTMRTAEEPREPAGMRIRHVVPAGRPPGGNGSGTVEDPFRGLTAAQAAAEPGDLFLIHGGVYAEGRWTVDRHGTPEKPIIYRGAGDGAAILDGGGGERLVSAGGLRYVWFERLTFRNARFLFVGHSGSHFVIRYCRLEVVGTGITAINGGYEESRGFVITDNVFQGPTSWPRSKGIEDINGLIITGAGHVVAYNHMSNLGDGIHGSQYGRLSASDIHNNDIEASTDDGIEADESDTNVRVFRNRISNAYSGISAQPSNGGPLYFFRNAIYNVVYSPFKLHNNTAGVLILHNTSAKSGIPFAIDPAGEKVSDVMTRNNLFIGTIGPALWSTGKMIRCDFDSDGYAWAGSGLGMLAGGFAHWNNANYGSPDAARRSGALYRQRGPVVMPAGGNFVRGLGPPSGPGTRVPRERVDLRLEPNSPAVDVGVIVPNFSDGFSGSAPDLGCCEFGQPLPHYGPRP
jgi:Right handed beta helix region